MTTLTSAPQASAASTHPIEEQPTTQTLTLLRGLLQTVSWAEIACNSPLKLGKLEGPRFSLDVKPLK
jgi:hypothetical protein